MKVKIVFFLLAVLLFPLILSTKQSPQPLADPATLKLLVAGKEIPPPTDETAAEFHGAKALPPRLATLKATSTVLGTWHEGNPLGDFKHIEVDLTNQKVYAYEGLRRVFEFTVSTGKWFPTPAGEYRIWSKVRATKMEGGNRARNTYYYLPNVPWVMFFYNNEIEKMRGFSLHGAYWHNNFGRPMSHGENSWSALASADYPGTKVTIYGTTPRE